MSGIKALYHVLCRFPSASPRSHLVQASSANIAEAVVRANLITTSAQALRLISDGRDARRLAMISHAVLGIDPPEFGEHIAEEPPPALFHLTYEIKEKGTLSGGGSLVIQAASRDAAKELVEFALAEPSLDLSVQVRSKMDALSPSNREIARTSHASLGLPSPIFDEPQRWQKVDVVYEPLRQPAPALTGAQRDTIREAALLLQDAALIKGPELAKGETAVVVSTHPALVERLMEIASSAEDLDQPRSAMLIPEWLAAEINQSAALALNHCYSPSELPEHVRELCRRVFNWAGTLKGNTALQVVSVPQRRDKGDGADAVALGMLEQFERATQRRNGAGAARQPLVLEFTASFARDLRLICSLAESFGCAAERLAAESLAKWLDFLLEFGGLPSSYVKVGEPERLLSDISACTEHLLTAYGRAPSLEGVKAAHRLRDWLMDTAGKLEPAREPPEGEEGARLAAQRNRAEKKTRVRIESALDIVVELADGEPVIVSASRSNKVARASIVRPQEEEAE